MLVKVLSHDLILKKINSTKFVGEKLSEEVLKMAFVLGIKDFYHFLDYLLMCLSE